VAVPNKFIKKKTKYAPEVKTMAWAKWKNLVVE
jgi:hypothetical protein